MATEKKSAQGGIGMSGKGASRYFSQTTPPTSIAANAARW
jgi:hypothetical protein